MSLTTILALRQGQIFHFLKKSKNTSNCNAGIEDNTVCTALSRTRSDAIRFALGHWDKEQFPEDYRELLELAIGFLGGTTQSGI